MQAALPVTNRSVSPARKPWSQRLLPYLMIAPTFLIVFLFTLKPAVSAVIDSTLKPARLAQDPPAFVGLQNYADLFNPTHHLGARFGGILLNTVLFAFGTVAIGMPLALGFALLINRRLPLRGVWRFGFVYPSLLPLIGAASIWAFIYADQVGLLAAILRAANPNWLGSPGLVLGAVIVVNVWSQTGYYMLLRRGITCCCSWPVCRVSPATCMKPPRWTGPITGSSCYGSHYPCCDGRRCSS